MHLAFSSDGVRPLSSLAAGARGLVVDVRSHDAARVDRLFALGVTPGAAIDVLQTFPAVVFRCDQTELAVEPGVAEVILVRVEGVGAHGEGSLRPDDDGAPG